MIDVLTKKAFSIKEVCIRFLNCFIFIKKYSFKIEKKKEMAIFIIMVVHNEDTFIFFNLKVVDNIS